MAKKSQQLTERFVRGAFTLMGLAAVVAVAVITVFLLVSGLPAIRQIGLVPFLSGTQWNPTASQPQYGILPFLLTSVYATTGALSLGAPVGFFAAVWLSKVAPQRLRGILMQAVGLLAGIPSIIYGLAGMLVFCEWLRLKTSLLAGALTLCIMTLPTLMRSTQESLKSVPQSLREGAFGLGAGKWRVIRTVVLPGSIDGIVSGCIFPARRARGV